MAATGRVGNLTKDQEAKLAKFKENIKDVLKDKHTDHHLLRFLRARSFNLKKTEEMFREDIEWRATNKISSILKDYKPPEVYEKHWVGGNIGCDKDGHIVVISNIGDVDPRGFVYSVTADDAKKLGMFMAQDLYRFAKENSKKQGRYVEGMTMVFDVEGLTAEYLWRPGIRMFTDPIQSILSEVRPVNQSSRTVRPRVLTLVDCIKPIETVIGYHPLCSDVNLNRNQLSVIRQIPREDAFVTKLKLQCSLWNARSIREKTGALIGSILENGTDIFLLTETWLKNQNDPTLGDLRLSLSGYDVTHFPRAQRRGGGVAFITRKNLTLKRLPSTKFKSFEHGIVDIRTSSELLRTVLVYRPPPSVGNKSSSISHFLPDFSTLMENILDSPGHLLITVLAKKLEEAFNKSQQGDAPVPPNPDPDALACAYFDAASEALDELAPIQKKTVIDKPRARWWTDALTGERKNVRRLEQRWRKSQMSIDLQIYRTASDVYHRNIDTAKTAFHRGRIETASSKQLFNIVDDLIGGKKAVTAVMPSNIPMSKVANAFSEFFDSRVREFRSHLPVPVAPHKPGHPPHHLTEFTPVTDEFVEKLIRSSTSKSCRLDPLPTTLVKNCKEVTVSILTRIINSSLMSGIFPRSLKLAVIRPLLKKANMDENVLRTIVQLQTFHT
ncbi:putative SEC14-like protein 2 [Apostichopus japonicus]|uniref:Putative SEC14-like protein 2 n=1 Tax=Stichopus japonicus TaxID=307972 RepID=A0A2G8LFI1_STIJA|nr:putative SEC14-like protein 2 [Apostichopus japonicus]